jgi:hypothetical protein
MGWVTHGLKKISKTASLISIGPHSNIKFTHIKKVDGMLVIGVKNNELKNKYQEQLPEDIFDRSYQVHQHHLRHHHHQQRHQYHDHQYHHRHH